MARTEPATSPCPHTILLNVSYVGTAFHGYALQPGDRTVAGVLLQAVQQMDPSVTPLRGVSRTDAGVHARGQLVAFDPSRTIPVRGWVLGLLSHLPDDVAVRAASVVERGFEPRAHVVAKLYRYSLLLDSRRDPFFDGFSWRVAAKLDLDAMRQAADQAIGTHDFAAFRTSADERESTVRTIHRIDWSRALQDPRVLHVDVVGNGFLHNMVRILVGTLVDVARGKLPASVVSKAIASGRREELGVTAPAQGLSLEAVRLDCDLDSSRTWPESGMRLLDDDLAVR